LHGGVYEIRVKVELAVWSLLGALEPSINIAGIFIKKATECSSQALFVSRLSLSGFRRRFFQFSSMFLLITLKLVMGESFRRRLDNTRSLCLFFSTT
jgi:hypothetical protein